MTVTNSFEGIRFGVATASLGMASCHTLELKFSALQKAGFKYLELGFGEYMAWVRLQTPDLPASTCPPAWSEADEPDPSDDAIWTALYAKAPDMIAYAASFGLTILMLQPLNQFDGYAPGTERAKWVKAKAERWLPLCSKLGIEQLQVGSNDFRDATDDLDIAAADLRWLAELGARQPRPVKIAYESWCFSWRVPDFETVWDIVQRGDHPDLGLCFDTAHTPLAPSYGWDPLTGNGWTDKEFEGVLDRIRAIPGDKIFYVELSDVLAPTTPLGKGSDFDAWRINANSPRGDSFVWAVCGRPIPLVGRHAGLAVRGEDDMGGARVVQQVKAVLSTGFKGPMMFEMFEAIRMEQDDPKIPAQYAEACARAEHLLRKAVDG